MSYCASRPSCKNLMSSVSLPLLCPVLLTSSTTQEFARMMGPGPGLAESSGAFQTNHSDNSHYIVNSRHAKPFQPISLLLS